MLPAAALLVLLVAACGGEDTGGDAGSQLSTLAKKLVGCLDGAGFKAKVKNTVPFAVEVPTSHVEVEFRSAAFHELHHADVWFFESNALALRNRPKITLQSEDNELNEVLGPAVINFNGYEPEAAARQEIRECVGDVAGVPVPGPTASATPS